MTEAPYTVAHLDEIEKFSSPASSPPNAIWHRIRSHFGVEGFGINAWTADEAGQGVIGEHDEAGTGANRHEELYLVLNGRARFTVDGEDLDAPAGTLVFVRNPESRRGAVAEEPGTTILTIGAKPGEPYAVSSWERNADVLRFWQTEEWDKAIEELSALHEQEPESAGILYNLACAETKAGRIDEAVAHLAQAVERHGDFAKSAPDDPDFAAIRDDPRFRSAVAGKA